MRTCTARQKLRTLPVRELVSLCAGDEVFKGMYGDWRIEESDVREVWGYRAGLSVAAAGARVFFLCLTTTSYRIRLVLGLFFLQV